MLHLTHYKNKCYNTIFLSGAKKASNRRENVPFLAVPEKLPRQLQFCLDDFKCPFLEFF